MGLEFKGVGDYQSLQNVVVTILYHVQFLHGTSTFNESSVLGRSAASCFPWMSTNVVNMVANQPPSSNLNYLMKNVTTKGMFLWRHRL
jgi:hypothetical protein